MNTTATENASRRKSLTARPDLETERVVFVYSGGKLVAEYSTKAPAAELRQPNTSRLTRFSRYSNHKPGRRGHIAARFPSIRRRDSKLIARPAIPRSLRTSALKYEGDDVRQKFTGYQKDEESGLDFAEARMYNNRHGRFTAVDPLLASGNSANPQTFNRYVYVMNSPLNFTDPSGLQVASCTDCLIFTNHRGLYTNYSNEEFKDRFIGEVTVDHSDGYRYLITGDNKSNTLTNLGKTAELEAAKSYNPSIRVAVFESTLYTEHSLPDMLKGPTGHVAFGVDNKTYSWDNSGYSNFQALPFEDYLDRNFSYRAGTVFELDFGSPQRNQDAAEEITLGPRNRTNLPSFFDSGYNMISNNCGETLCRITERLDLPERSRFDSITPAQHYVFINDSLRPFITNQVRREPRRQFDDFQVQPVPQPLPTPTP